MPHGSVSTLCGAAQPGSAGPDLERQVGTRDNSLCSPSRQGADPRARVRILTSGEGGGSCSPLLLPTHARSHARLARCGGWRAGSSATPALLVGTGGEVPGGHVLLPGRLCRLAAAFADDDGRRKRRCADSPAENV